MKVIIINGMAASGKSTFVSLSRQSLKNTIELSMIDFVKEVADYAGWKHEKTEEGRKFLVNLKDAIDAYNKNILYNHIDNDIRYWTGVYSYGCADDIVFFINARSPEDIEYLKNKYNAVTLFITNPRVPNITSNHADGHVNEYTYDYTITNDGTMEEYAEKAKKFMEMILNGK